MKSPFKSKQPDKQPEQEAQAPSTTYAKFELVGIVRKVSINGEDCYLSLMFPREDAWQSNSKYDSINVKTKLNLFKAPHEGDIIKCTGFIQSYWNAPTRSIGNTFTAETVEIIERGTFR